MTSIFFPAESTSTFENIYDDQGRRTQYIRGVASTAQCGRRAEMIGCTTPLVHLAPLTGEVDPTSGTCFFRLNGAADATGLAATMG